MLVRTVDLDQTPSNAVLYGFAMFVIQRVLKGTKYFFRDGISYKILFASHYSKRNDFAQNRSKQKSHHKNVAIVRNGGKYNK